MGEENPLQVLGTAYLDGSVGGLPKEYRVEGNAKFCGST